VYHNGSGNGAKKNPNSRLTGGITFCYPIHRSPEKVQPEMNQKMANQPNKKNIQRGLRVDRTLDAKVLKRFYDKDTMTVKDAYILALQFATRKVELTPEDHERIAEEIRAAKNNVKTNKKGISK